MPPLHLYTPEESAPAPLRIDAIYKYKPGASVLLPLLQWRICAGFPSPASDFTEERLSLDELVLKNPPATFMMRVSGKSMEEAGIFDGDLLIVDRSKTPKDGSIVIAYLNGELTVKRLEKHGKRFALASDNPAYPPILVSEEMDFEVWGVATHVLRDLEG